MERREFYKTYYRVTDGIYSDLLILTKEDREGTRRKGQIYLSKWERKALILTQYLILLGELVCSVAGWDLPGFPGFLFFLMACTITDFSFIKMEVVYQVYRREELFARILHQGFLGKTQMLWDGVKPYVQKRISGFCLTGKWKLWLRYSILERKGQTPGMITVTPWGIRIRMDGRELCLRERGMSMESAAEQIAGFLNGK